MLATLYSILAQTDVDAIPSNIQSFAIKLIGAVLFVVVGYRVLKAVIGGSTAALFSVAILAGLSWFILNNVDVIGNLFGAILRRFGIA